MRGREVRTADGRGLALLTGTQAPLTPTQLYFLSLNSFSMAARKIHMM